MTSSLIRYSTVFESTNNLPRTIELGHGENADLIASFKDDGVDVDLTGYTAMAIFQPRSKWGTDEWYDCPCEITDNNVIAHWGHATDNGDNAVKLFLYLTKDGKVAYPAIYQLKLFETPGFDPSPIAPVPKILDFSQYVLLNAPWVPLTANSTLSGDLTMDSCDIFHSETKTVTLQNISYSNDTELYYSGNVTVAIDRELLDELYHVSDERIPAKVTGILDSTGETVVENVTLTSSQPSPSGSGRIRWQVLDENNANIGILDFSYEAESLQANSGTLHGDYLMTGSIEDTVDEEVTEVKNYIYDDFSKASKKEVRKLESDVNELAENVDNIVAEKIPFTKKTVQASGASTIIYPNSHEVVGVSYGNNPTQFTISLPTGKSGIITDFYVDVIIPELLPPSTTLTVLLVTPQWEESGYWKTWKLAFDNGESWSNMNVLGEGTLTRFHFRELGTVDGNGNPMIYITSDSLQIPE
jgi:hypothetical protein